MTLDEAIEEAIYKSSVHTSNIPIDKATYEAIVFGTKIIVWSINIDTYDKIVPLEQALRLLMEKVTSELERSC